MGITIATTVTTSTIVSGETSGVVENRLLPSLGRPTTKALIAIAKCNTVVTIVSGAAFSMRANSEGVNPWLRYTTAMLATVC